ncbi:MAG: tetratricopeptide repeat protein [Spirochaetia bacterium]
MKRNRKKERQIFDEYLETSLELLNKKEISSDNIREIAEELGFSGEDLTRIEEAVEKLKKRGASYLQNGYYDGAIQDFTKAAALNPFDVEIKTSLAESYYRRGRDDKSPSDFANAESWAEDAIRIDPSSQPGYQVLHNIKRHREKRKKNIISAVAAAGAAGIILLFFLLFFPILSSSVPERSPITPVQPVSSNEISIAGTQPRGKIPKQQIPVRLSETVNDSYELFVQSSVLNEYNNSYSYELTGEIKNDTTVITALMIKATAYDSEGRALFIIYQNLLRSSEPSIFPGDILPVYLLKYEQGKKAPEVDTIVLSFQLTEGYAFSGPPLDYPEIPIAWEPNQPPGMDLRFTVRNSKIASLNPPSHFLVLGIENTGSLPIDNLRIKLEHRNKNGELIASSLHYCVVSTDPNLRPGTRFPKFFTGKLPKGTTEITSVSASVIEID